MNSIIFLRTYFRSFLLIFLSVLLPILSSSLLTGLLLYYEPILLGWRIWQWILLYTSVAILMGCALMPTTLMAILTGYFLAWNGTPFMIVAYLIASIIGYSLGKLLQGNALSQHLLEKPQVKRFLSILNQKGWKLIILVRLSPVLAFALVNFVLATIKMPLRIFLVGSLVGMLPRTLASIWIGTRIQSLKLFFEGNTDATLPYSELILIVLTIITIFGVCRLIQTTLYQVKTDRTL